MNNEALDKLLSSKKYGNICPDTVRRVFGECEARYKKPKDVEKAAREKLHGITGMFMTHDEAKACRADMDAWFENPSDELLGRMLSRHSSTRERLPLARMDECYDRIFAVTGKPETILDLACGINPVYLSARGYRVHGADISGDAADLVNRFGERSGTASCECGDLLCGMPEGEYSLALAFKLLPVLENQRNGSAVQLLNSVQARYIAVSFPTRTLGGRNVGMEKHYGEWMESHLPEKLEIAGRFISENELFYILKEQ